jgi:hypothetical protein
VEWLHQSSITLIGAKTKVHHNCTEGDIPKKYGGSEYGLQVDGTSTIQLKHTKVSMVAIGGRGADINQDMAQ